MKDSIDLGTASGRLIANVLASVAAYETEIRGERVKAAQSAAKASGKKWGGSQKGCLLKVPGEQARTVSLSRLTIYRVLERYEQGLIELDIAI